MNYIIENSDDIDVDEILALLAELTEGKREIVNV